ncbi:MAG: type II secretion system protein [Verrucomicrobiales bacterium]|nr:type II secretion system protein [Verrucomicrobiales bacterium]
MFLTYESSTSHRRAMSLVEILVTIVVLGVIAAIAVPSVSRIRESAKEAAAIKNAKTIAQMSGALAALGVAHVIPDSMGGAEATARLLREGVTVPEGVMEGEVFVIPGMTDEHIEEVGVFLDVKYDKRELRLEFVPPVDKNAIFDLKLDCYDAICKAGEPEMRSKIIPGVLSMICLSLSL